MRREFNRFTLQLVMVSFPSVLRSCKDIAAKLRIGWIELIKFVLSSSLVFSFPLLISESILGGVRESSIRRSHLHPGVSFVLFWN